MSSFRFKWADLFAGLFVVLFTASLLVSADIFGIEKRNRVKCASNLRMIGQACLLYANENRGSYPRTVYDRKNPVPVWGTPYESGGKDLGPGEADAFVKDDAANAKYKPAANDVTAAIFLLMRTEDITSAVFICPSTKQKKWDFGGGMNTAQNWSNWAGTASLRDHLSYSMQNPYASTAGVKKGFIWNSSMAADVAVFADMNPGTEVLTKLKMTSNADEMRKGNSINHNRDGQNILYGDGHVEFQNNPFAGTKRDNCYTFGDSGDAKPDGGGEGIAGSPGGAEDSVLLPTSVGVGSTDPEVAPEGL